MHAVIEAAAVVILADFWEIVADFLFGILNQTELFDARRIDDETIHRLDAIHLGESGGMLAFVVDRGDLPYLDVHYHIKNMKIHFIAIGGSAMHNLAIALKLKGYEITGSDDEIFEPAKGRLQKYGILPDSIGWNPDKITADLDAVILGMHAREDNPELLKAKELGIKIFSYPEFLYEQSKDKCRIVVGGSHGKRGSICHAKLTYHR